MHTVANPAGSRIIALVCVCARVGVSVCLSAGARTCEVHVCAFTCVCVHVDVCMRVFTCCNVGVAYCIHFEHPGLFRIGFLKSEMETDTETETEQ